MSLSFRLNIFLWSPVSFKGKRNLLLFPHLHVSGSKHFPDGSLCPGVILDVPRAATQLVGFLCSLVSPPQSANSWWRREAAGPPLHLPWEDGSPFLPALETRERSHGSMTLGLQERASGAALSQEREVIFHFPLPLGVSGGNLDFKYNNQVYALSKPCLVPLATALTFIACRSSL